MNPEFSMRSWPSRLELRVTSRNVGGPDTPARLVAETVIEFKPSSNASVIENSPVAASKLPQLPGCSR